MSSNALATNVSVGAQFGYNRWDTNSAVLTNTLGANKGYFGAAAAGASNWPNEYLSGSVGPSAATLFVISTSTSIGIYSAARTSDGTSWSPQELLAVNDAANKTIWGQGALVCTPLTGRAEQYSLFARAPGAAAMHKAAQHCPD